MTRRVFRQSFQAGHILAKKEEHAVYRVTEVIGASSVSWEDAARSAVETASEIQCDPRIAEVASRRRAGVAVDNCLKESRDDLIDGAYPRA